MAHFQQKARSTSKLIAVLTLFPFTGVCLLLSGLTLTGTLIGLAIATPVLLILSPILVPAALTIGLVITGFLASGAFGMTALSSVMYIVNYLRGKSGGDERLPLDYAKRRSGDTAGYVGQKRGPKNLLGPE